MNVSAADFDFVRRTVVAESGLTLAPGKEYLVDSRLKPLAQRAGLGSVQLLIAAVRAGDTKLRGEVAQALATQETYFFRDVHPFETLRRIVIPDLLAKNPTGYVRIWSAATATGQEAYSLAMVMREYFPGVPAQITASDFSSTALAVAERGRFEQLNVNRGLPAGMLVKYFERDGYLWRVRDEIRRMITFKRINLTQRFPALPPMDVIFIRNVLTYLEPAVRSSILHKCARVLQPDGYLFIGAAETTYGLDSPFETKHLERTVCYRLRREERNETDETRP